MEKPDHVRPKSKESFEKLVEASLAQAQKHMNNGEYIAGEVALLNLNLIDISQEITKAAIDQRFLLDRIANALETMVSR